MSTFQSPLHTLSPGPECQHSNHLLQQAPFKAVQKMVLSGIIHTMGENDTNDTYPT